MNDLQKHKEICGSIHFWCNKGIAKCNKCGRQFYEKGGKKLTISNLIDKQVKELEE